MRRSGGALGVLRVLEGGEEGVAVAVGGALEARPRRVPRRLGVEVLDEVIPDRLGHLGNLDFKATLDGE